VFRFDSVVNLSRRAREINKIPPRRRICWETSAQQLIPLQIEHVVARKHGSEAPVV